MFSTRPKPPAGAILIDGIACSIRGMGVCMVLSGVIFGLLACVKWLWFGEFNPEPISAYIANFSATGWDGFDPITRRLLEIPAAIGVSGLGVLALTLVKRPDLRR